MRPVERICIGVESHSLHVAVLEVFQQVVVELSSIFYRRTLLWRQSNSIGSSSIIDRRMVCRKEVVHSSDGSAFCAGKNVVTVWREDAAMVDGKYNMKEIKAQGSSAKQVFTGRKDSKTSSTFHVVLR